MAITHVLRCDGSHNISWIATASVVDATFLLGVERASDTIQWTTYGAWFASSGGGVSLLAIDSATKDIFWHTFVP